MPRDHKITLRLNDAEHYYALMHSGSRNVSLPDHLRDILQDHIVRTEGERAAVHILRGHPPDRTA